MARNNPSVTLTFAGDTKQVTRATDEGVDATDRFRRKVSENATAMARDTERSVTEQSRALGFARYQYSRTGESFEDMVNRMARAKRRADQMTANLRMLGLQDTPMGRAYMPPAQDAGESAGDGFLRGFGQRVSTGLRSMGSGPLIGGAIASLPGLFGPVGLLAGGALVVGFGAGLAGLGLAVAAKSPLVVAHFERLKVEVQAKLMQISKPFEQTLVDMIANARTVFNSFAPELGKAFPVLAKDISEFSANLTEAFRQLAPIIQPVVEAFGKILDSLGPKLPGVFQNIANALISLADAVGRNSDGFAKMIVFFLNFIPATLNVITAMIEFGEWWGSVWRGIGSVISWAWGIISSIYGFIIDGAARMADFVGGIFGRMKEAVTSRIQEVLSGARDFPSAFRAAVGDLGRILWDAGWRLVGGLIDGIKAQFQRVRDTLTNLTSMLPQWKGPVDVDARLLTNNGRLIIGSLVDGFRQEEPSVQGYLEELTGFIGGFGPDEPSLSTSPVRGAAPSGGKQVIELRSDGSPVGDFLVALLQPTINARGGDVNAVLGKG